MRTFELLEHNCVISKTRKTSQKQESIDGVPRMVLCSQLVYNGYFFDYLPLSFLFSKIIYLDYLLICSLASNVIHCDFQTVRLQDVHVVIENCPMAANCAREVTSSIAIVTVHLVASSANVTSRTGRKLTD